MSGESEHYSTSGDSGFYSGSGGSWRGGGGTGGGPEDENIEESDYVKVPKRDSKPVKPPNPPAEGASRVVSSTRQVLIQVKKQPWYHDEMDRDSTEKLLRNKPAGTFLVRYSKKNPVADKDGYLKTRERVVLSLVLADGKTFKHAAIKSHCVSADDQETSICKVFLTDTPVKTFEHVTELIDHYAVSSLAGINTDVFGKEDSLKHYITPHDPDQIIEVTMGRDIQRRRSLSPGKLQRTCTLDTSGGTMQLDNSDVRLDVPSGAIPPGLTYTINKKIHVTNLDEFRSHVTSWSKDEYFVSPVPEYTISQVTMNGAPVKQDGPKFTKHVTICIPHCVPEEKYLPNVKVYCSDPERKEFGKPVPRATSQGPAPDCYYTVDSQYVWIHTLHFTQYICTCGGELNLYMETLLFACMKEYTDFQEVYLSVYLCESLFRLPAFKQILKDDEAQLYDPRHLITQTALKLPPEMTHRDQFQLEVEPFVDPEDENPEEDPTRSPWRHVVGRGLSPTKIIDAGDVLECFHICRGGIPPPRPKDVKFQLRNRGHRVESFTGHLNVNVAKQNGNPTYAQANLNNIPFTVDLRHALRVPAGTSLEGATASAASQG